MKKVLQVLGGIFLVILIGVGALLLYKGGGGPDIQELLKSDEGIKVTSEALGFYYKDLLINGQVYRPAKEFDGKLPAVVYVQSIESGRVISRELAAQGLVVYAFDFTGEDAKLRVKELKEVVKQVSGIRYVDSSKVFLLGDGQGCLAACNYTFENPKKTAGLMLISPGFNPLEISAKAKRYSGQILVVDGSLGMKPVVKEIYGHISGK